MGIILFPFRFIWSLISIIFQLTGRLIGVVIGLALMIAGLVLTVTIVGAIAGIPLAILGLLLTIRSLLK